MEIVASAAINFELLFNVARYKPTYNLVPKTYLGITIEVSSIIYNLKVS